MVNPAGKCDRHRDRVRWGGGKGRGRWLVVSGTKRPASEAIRTLRMTTQEIALALSRSQFRPDYGVFRRLRGARLYFATAAASLSRVSVCAPSRATEKTGGAHR